MAIFGMNGLMFLALDFALIFAVYGQKEVALTVNQVAKISRVEQRKGLSGDKATDASAIATERQKIVQEMATNAARYSSTTAKQRQAFASKDWLR